MVTLAARAALWLRPSEAVRQMLFSERRSAARCPIEKLVWAVEVANQYVPRGTCLTRALVMEHLLQRNGMSYRFCIGVKEESGGVVAHAWIECDGEVVIGGPSVSPYTPIFQSRVEALSRPA
jgi:hypothetical protein